MDTQTTILQREIDKYKRATTLHWYHTKNWGLDDIWIEGYNWIEDIGIPQTVIDIGCGNGKLVRHLRVYEAIDAYGVDLISEGISPDTRAGMEDAFYFFPAWDYSSWVKMRNNIFKNNVDARFDLGISADFLEHIPPEYLNAVLNCIHNFTHQSIHKINLRRDKEWKDPANRKHLSLYSPEEWMYKFSVHVGEPFMLRQEASNVYIHVSSNGDNPFVRQARS